MAGTDECSNISKTLFTNIDGTSMTFFMRPCNERQQLRSVIENGGGKITSKLMQGSIKLAEKGSMVSCEGYISTKFITDCVEQNQLLDTSPYKVTSGTRVRSNSGNSDVSIHSFDTNDSMSPAPYVIQSTRDIKGRNKYTKEEDIAMLNFLIDQRRYSEATGMRVFKDMEMLKITSHSASSMNTRYRKCILPNIENYKYDIDPKWLTRLTGGVPVKDKEPDFSVDALFTVSRKRNVTGKSSMKKFFKADQVGPSELVDENNLKPCKPADQTVSKQPKLTICANNHKNDAIDKPSLDDVDRDVKAHKKDKSVTESCSTASWHTANDTISIKSNRRDQSVDKNFEVLAERKDAPPELKEKQCVYELHSQTESSNGIEKSVELENNESTVNETKSDKASKGSPESNSLVDVFEMSDGTMTQVQQFNEDNDTEDFELDPDFVTSPKQTFDDREMFENKEKQLPEMEETILPQCQCNKTDIVPNNNNNQQSDDTETQPPQQINCNTVSSSSDMIVSSTYTVQDDSFDKMLMDYVSSEKEAKDIEKDKSETISEQDSFDEMLKNSASVEEPSVKNLHNTIKKKNEDKKASKTVGHGRSKLIHDFELDGETSDSINVQERKEIDRCTCLCKKLSGEYGLSFNFVVKLLIQCNGDDERLESHIMYGPYSPNLPPWSPEDDVLLMTNRASEKLARKFGEDDVHCRFKYLTD